jgi:hypothetical protein
LSGLEFRETGSCPGRFSGGRGRAARNRQFPLLPGGRSKSPVDLQDGMLQKLSTKIRGTELVERIHLVKCKSDKINISEKIDFGLAFWMVHEVPNKESFFKELKAILNEKTQILMVEPKSCFMYRARSSKRRLHLLSMPDSW